MFLLKLISYLPLRVLYLLSDLIFVFGYDILRYRRVVVQANLRNAFPEKAPEELRRIEKEFYHNLCDYPNRNTQVTIDVKGRDIPADEV